MNFEPMFDKVLLKKIKQSETTKGGLVLPGTVTEKSWKGEVIAVGKGKLLDDGSLIQNCANLYVNAEDKNGVIWKFEKQEISKHYRNRKGVYVTATYHMSDLKKSNKTNSYRKFFSSLAKKSLEGLFGAS